MSELLGVVERTVLLHLQHGELQGERRGRRWRITRESVEKHPNYRGEAPRTDVVPPLPRRNPKPATEAPAARTTEPEAPLTAPFDPKRPRREWTYHKLEVLHELAALATRTAHALRDLDAVPAAVVDMTLRAAMDAARHGAAGFHAFAKADKMRLYARAREHLAMTAASLDITADLAEGRGEGLRAMSREYESLAPRLGALLRGAGGRDA